MLINIKNRVKIIVVSLILTIPVLGIGLSSGSVYASPTQTGAGSNVANSLCSGIGGASGNGAAVSDGSCTTSNPNNKNTLEAIAAQVVSIFSYIVGAASVVMIIYGGFRYVTSGGDSGRVGNAKNTLIYAIIGLVIVALAQVIVHFVLTQATLANPTSSLILLVR